MTEPTLESLNEAARAAGFDDWNYVRRGSVGIGAADSIRAHALTLDELHGRKEVSEAAEFWAALSDASSFPVDAVRIRAGEFEPEDKRAIALIEAKFAELRADSPTRGDA